MRVLRVIQAFGAFGVCGAVAVAAGGCATSAVLEQELTKTNTQTVLAFEETVFNKHEVQEAFAHYVGPSFIQHTPRLLVDRDAALQAYEQLVTRQFPDSRLMVERTVAQADVVVTQGRWQQGLGGALPIAVVDIYRLRDGRIVEHWDVVQDGEPALAATLPAR